MKFPFSVDAYMVGGAVRDTLLRRKPGDRDWVVVGATVPMMLELGFQPVGKDFPVFLHPQTHEEYALARTERKTAPGYHGFTFHAAPDVTLEQDLFRRDLTINAMAMDETGQLIDPFQGRADLNAGILRHVSPAFAEDPVRILRVARFAARFGFTVAEETLQLMREMTANGEIDALVAERVWQEMARALMEDKPSGFFHTLRTCGALARILPEIDALFGVPQRADYHPEVDTGMHVMMVLDDAAACGYPLSTRFAALTHDLGKALTPAEVLPSHIGHEGRGEKPLRDLCQRLRVPSDCRELALMTTSQHTKVHCAGELRPSTVLKLFKACDALRRPERFHQMLDACGSDSRGRTGFEAVPYPQADWLRAMLDAARSLDAGTLAARTADKKHLPAVIDQARLDLIADWRKTHLPMNIQKC